MRQTLLSIMMCEKCVDDYVKMCRNEGIKVRKRYRVKSGNFGRQVNSENNFFCIIL